MSNGIAGGKMSFEMGFSKPAPHARIDPEEPFRLAVLGDFSGRENRGLTGPVEQRRLVRVDIDTAEKVFVGWEAQLQLLVKETMVSLEFNSLDDFHPDVLPGRIEPVSALISLRERVVAGAPLEQISGELRARLGAGTADSAAVVNESNRDTLSRLLGGAKPKAPPATGAQAAVEQILRKAVAGSTVPGQTPERQAVVAAIDLELSDWLRVILHHPDFQALESAWRGLDLLVRSFGGEENLQVYAADIAQRDVMAELAGAEDFSSTQFHRWVRTQVETRQLAVLAGLYSFRPEEKHARALANLARIGARAGAPFVGAASPGFVGCECFGRHADPDDWRQPLEPEFNAAWDHLRGIEETAYLGLCLPRFLLRQPYGRDGEQTRKFPFEEISGEGMHEEYLWGNPVVACAHVLASFFQTDGWEMRAEGWGELDELPLHCFVKDGEKEAKPCAEAWLSDRAGERILRGGLIPLLSIRGRSAVRIGRLQSVHRTGCALAGPWRG